MLGYFTTLLLAMGAIPSVVTSSRQYVGQIRIYVDDAAMKNWMNVTGKTQDADFRLEMRSTIFEINQILMTLQKHGLNIQLQIEQIVVLNHNILTVDSEGKIINKESLRQFENWIKPKYAAHKYDLAILFTGHNMVRNKTVDKAFGYAYIGSVCSPTALGVIELHGTYWDVLAASHEIGHILGGQHDGSQFSSNCSDKSGEVMNAFTLMYSRQHFFYSSCTARNIKDTLGKLAGDKNCLLSWPRSGEISGPRIGTLMSPDDVCKRQFGNTSYIARAAYSQYGDDICTQIACMTSTVGTRFNWSFLPTPQGLACGKNKQCILGRCVETSGGSALTPDWCPFGDQPKIEGSYQMTCSDIPTCQGWSNTCCQTCHDPGTADDVCRSLAGNHSSMARRSSTSHGDELCSKLACLISVIGNRFNWNYYTAPNGMKCGKHKRCNKGKCVWSSIGDPTMSDECPYGDQPWLGGMWNSNCSTYIQRHGCSGQGWKDICCATCHDPGTADEICQRLVGANSSLARRHYTHYGDNLCSQLACLTSVVGNHFNWNYFTTPEGMKCGQNKRCSKGKCVSAVSGDSHMSDSCPYGDQPFLGGIWNTTCKAFIQHNGCSGLGWKDICCSSCAGH